MSDDNDVKKAILARRAKFIAAALAGASSVTACRSPQPCLEPPPVPPDGGTSAPQITTQTNDPPPQPCLSPPYIPPSADAAPSPVPTPCLKVKATPPPTATPRPCLSVAVPVPKPPPGGGEKP